MKKKISILALSASMLACLALGAVGCTTTEEPPVDDFKGKIVVETEKTQISVMAPFDYKMPTAAVYDENDEVAKSREVRMSLIDSTGMYIYEKTLDYKSMRFLDLGAYQLVYEADGCDDVVINIYICDQLSPVENLKLTGSTLTWDAVEGAAGYEICVNGGESVIVEDESYTLEGDGSFLVSVAANGDEKSFVDSEQVRVEKLASNQLATFNTVNYMSEVVPGNPNVTSDQIKTEWRPGKIMKFDGALGENGALNIQPLASPIGGQKLFIFTVNLQQAIDYTNYDAMKVRFLVEWISQNEGGQKAYFTVLHANDATHSSYKTEIKGEGPLSIEIKQDTENGPKTDFQTLTLMKSDLEALGYAQGATTVTFGIWAEAVSTAGSACTWLDDVSMVKYNPVATPQNVKITGNMLTWDAVEGAGGYTIKTDGGDKISVTENQYDLTQLGKDARLSVYAEPAADGFDTSMESAKVDYFYADEKVLASFNSVIYTSILQAGSPVEADAHNKAGAFRSAPAYSNGSETGLDGIDGGAVRVGIFLTNYVSTDTANNIHTVTVNLPQAIDLDNDYDGIEIKFAMNWVSAGYGDTTYFSVLSAKTKSAGYTTIPTEAGAPYVQCTDTDNSGYEEAAKDPVAWDTLRLTKAQLQALGYQTGDKQIVLSIWRAKSGANTYGASLVLDYISYYKEEA